MLLLLEHAPELFATVLVAGLLVFAAWAVTRLITPRIPQKDAYADTDLIAEYGRVWCLHQLVPFADKLLFGSYGQAMDNRMLVPWEKGPADWMIRLPLVLASLLFPKHELLMLAHLANLISLVTWSPSVWDHMNWAGLLEATFVLAALASGGRARVQARFFPAARAQLVVLYWSAAFWKLTTSWYAVRSSCAPVLLSELLAGIFPPEVLPAGSPAANAFLRIAPVFVAALEFAVAAALTWRPSVGVVLALGFHQTINLMPMTYAGGFSIAMCTRFVLFLPGVVTRSLGPSDSWMLPSALTAAVGAAMYAIHSGVDSACILYLALAFLYLRGLMSGHHLLCGPCTHSWLSMVALAIGFFYGFLTPILGLQAMASSTMYANLKQWGGGNHLLVPTGLLQEHFLAGDAGPAWASDAFGGGLLRVDSTNSTLLQQLSPAEATPQLPPHARELLRGVGGTGRYFELYAARNYFGREDDLAASALHNRGAHAPEVRRDDPPYVQPAYEMRRVLALARRRGDGFFLKYTKVPWRGTPGAYAAHIGEQVVLEENPAAGRRSCTVAGAACSSSEVALLPPPPRWLTFLLHPYPMPLLPGDDREVHCST